MRNYTFEFVSTALFAIVVTFFYGCKSYQPAPVEWDAVSSQWHGESAHTEIDLVGAIQCSLALNPEINALRLRMLSAQRYAAQAGWWRDPSLGFDVLRILDGGPHPYIAGVGLGFTLPLTGLPRLEKLAALCYAEADRLAVVAAERDLEMRVVREWAAMVYAAKRIALMDETLQDHRQLSMSVQELVGAGEMERTVGDRLLQEEVQRRHRIDEQRRKLAEQRIGFFGLMGLHPLAGVNLVLTEEGLDEWQRDAEVCEEMDLIRHARVREQIARLDATEQDLRIEIRRQYPEIEIGPRFANENNSARAGLGADATLPLWNRNRRGVAAAEGTRDYQRNGAVIAWKEHVRRYREVCLLIENSRRSVSQIESERLPPVRDAALRARKLLQQGECGIAGLIEAQNLLCDAEVELSSARERLAFHQIEAHFITMKED